MTGLTVVALTLLLAVALSVLAHAIFVAPADLRLTVIDLPVAGLPAEFDGYRIAILTDLHHGPQQPVARARRAVAYANSQAPDLVVLLGDYGTSEPGWKQSSHHAYYTMFDALGPELRALRATDGVLAVLGNHDFYADAQATANWLRSLGFRVLRNDAVPLTRSGAILCVVGIDDLVAGRVSREDVARLVHGDTPTILLSHHPDSVVFCGDSAVRLVLSGHTHGGQIVIPGIGAPVTRSRMCTRRTPAGWVPNDYAPLFVSRGVGVQIPIRLRCPPEVVVATLRRAAQHPV